MVICPECDGAKTLPGVACIMDSGCRPFEAACEFCKGEGQVSPEAYERFRKGQQMRYARVEQGRSTFEEAARPAERPMSFYANGQDARERCEVERPTAESDHRTAGPVPKSEGSRPPLITHPAVAPRPWYRWWAQKDRNW